MLGPAQLPPPNKRQKPLVASPPPPFFFFFWTVPAFSKPLLVPTVPVWQPGPSCLAAAVPRQVGALRGYLHPGGSDGCSPQTFQHLSPPAPQITARTGGVDCWRSRWEAPSQTRIRPSHPRPHSFPAALARSQAKTNRTSSNAAVSTPPARCLGFPRQAKHVKL